MSHVFDDELCAPPLLWSECRSTLHEAVWRGGRQRRTRGAGAAFLTSGAIRVVNRVEVDEAAWQLADRMGWAKTYDAEYVALASVLGRRLVTLDAALHRGTRRLGFVVSPEEVLEH